MLDYKIEQELSQFIWFFILDNLIIFYCNSLSNRQNTAGHTSATLHSSPVDQLAEYFWSHFGYSPLITSGSAGRVLLVTLRLLSTHHPWISWRSAAGHTSVTLHSSPVDQLAEHSWSHFWYSPLITRGSAGRVLLVTLLLHSTHHPWVSWQSTAGHTSATLHSYS
jgi:hypothetical protein